MVIFLGLKRRFRGWGEIYLVKFIVLWINGLQKGEPLAHQANCVWKSLKLDQFTAWDKSSVAKAYSKDLEVRVRILDSDKERTKVALGIELGLFFYMIILVLGIFRINSRSDHPLDNTNIILKLSLGKIKHIYYCSFCGTYRLKLGKLSVSVRS